MTSVKRNPPFVTDVKNELVKVSGMYDGNDEKCCRRAELIALFRMGAVLKFSGDKQPGIAFANNNAAVTRRVFTLLRAENTELPLKTAVARANRFRKRNSYIVTAAKSAATDELLHRLEILKDGRINIGSDGNLVRRECCRRAYLLGAFLGGGSVNRPDAQNHLEIKTGGLATAEFLQGLFLRFDFPAGMYERRDEFVVYLKEGESIIEFLAMLNAKDSAERFEIAANLKAVRAQVNRLVNFETANVQRAVNSAAKQVAAAKVLKDSTAWETLSDEIKRTVILRLENPEASLTELAQILYLTKSGTNHRLARILELATKIGGQKS